MRPPITLPPAASTFSGAPLVCSAFIPRRRATLFNDLIFLAAVFNPPPRPNTVPVPTPSPASPPSARPCNAPAPGTSRFNNAPPVAPAIPPMPSPIRPGFREAESVCEMVGALGKKEAAFSSITSLFFFRGRGQLRHLWPLLWRRQRFARYVHSV